MAYPLLENPYKHFHDSRAQTLGIALHVTAGLEDFTPPDSGAESTIRYGQSNVRPASWHGIVDSDSIVDCLPDSYTAFHVIGYNSKLMGLEIANHDAKWAGKPERWVGSTIANAAAWCRPRVAKYGLPVELCTKAEADAAIRAGRPFGFTYHRYLDPSRRIDPGFDFPWSQFKAALLGAGDASLASVIPAAGVLAMGESRFTVDGIMDAATVRMLQRIWGAPITGKFDAPTVGAMQRWLGVDDDEIVGPNTRTALYKRIGYSGDPKVGWSYGWTDKPTGATRALEVYLNGERDRQVKAGGAPSWPLPIDHRIGANPKGYASWHDGGAGDPEGNAALRTWQTKMLARGWKALGVVDGLWGPATAAVVVAFQAEKIIPSEAGCIGPATWRAAFEAPVT